MAMLMMMLVVMSQTSRGQSQIARGPDVVLARAEESLEALKSLDDEKLDASKLSLLKAKNPAVALFGRLAEETRSRGEKVESICELMKDGDATVWSRQKTEAVRGMMVASPFRDALRQDAGHGFPMTLQFAQTTTVEFYSGGKHHLTILNEEPVGSSLDLSAAPLRLADLPPVLQSSREFDRKPQGSVSCLVPKRTAPWDRLPTMQSGLKALAALEEENARLLKERLKEFKTSELSNSEREQALSAFADNFQNEGFSTRAEALTAAKGADLLKRTSLSAKVMTTDSSGEKSSVGWTVSCLPNH